MDTTTYEMAVLEQGNYEAGRLRSYVSKLGQYLSKSDGAAAFLLRHSGERVFYVAPWLKSTLWHDDDDREAVSTRLGGSEGAD